MANNDVNSNSKNDLVKTFVDLIQTQKLTIEDIKKRSDFQQLTEAEKNNVIINLENVLKAPSNNNKAKKSKKSKGKGSKNSNNSKGKGSKKQQ